MPWLTWPRPLVDHQQVDTITKIISSRDMDCQESNSIPAGFLVGFLNEELEINQKPSDCRILQGKLTYRHRISHPSKIILFITIGFPHRSDPVDPRVFHTNKGAPPRKRVFPENYEFMYEGRAASPEWFLAKFLRSKQVGLR